MEEGCQLIVAVGKNKAIFSIIIAYVPLKQGYISFQGSPVSLFVSPFSSPFHVLVMSNLGKI